MQHEHYTHTAPELVFCIRFQNHRHAQPVALGKGNIQHLSHIALPLIFLPHTDKSNENAGLPFLVHAVLQGSPSPLDNDTKLQKALHVRYCFCGIPICRHYYLTFMQKSQRSFPRPSVMLLSQISFGCSPV